MTQLEDRRAFLRAVAAAGVARATADLAQVEEALAFARQQTIVAVPAATKALTAAQAQVVTALTSRIIPSVEGRPGAVEAGAMFFIDRALATFNASLRSLYVDGIADLDRRARAKIAGAAGFAALTAAQQDEVLREIEATPFFQTARVDTIFGTLALPTWGGNRDYTGWRMLGFEHEMTFRAPFGYYDADANRGN